MVREFENRKIKSGHPFIHIMHLLCIYIILYVAFSLKKNIYIYIFIHFENICTDMLLYYAYKYINIIYESCDWRLV